MAEHDAPLQGAARRFLTSAASRARPFFWWYSTRMKLSEVLRERGYVYQHSSETLEEITDGKKRTVYLGIDPSADSLHVGNLVVLLALRRFLEDGHSVILLTGGGTGMIGDPGGRSGERALLDEETIAHNSARVRAQMEKVFGTADFNSVNNADWLYDLKLLDFLRDVGKHFTVNAMIKKEMVRERLDAESPISFTEFSYSLLQGYDFMHLNAMHGCDVQIGGSDQWGNILAGVEYVRRASGRTVYGLTVPLLINKATGRKFGKSEEGAIWLDSAKTTPFMLYQFFLNTDDDAVEEYLLKLTLLPKSEIDEMMQKHASAPGERQAQRLLANTVTELVHGADAAHSAEKMSETLFGRSDAAALSKDEVTALLEGVPSLQTRVGEPLADVLVQAALAASKREARQFMADGAVALNGAKVTDPSRVLMKEDFQNAPVAIVRRGRRNAAVLTLGS